MINSNEIRSTFLSFFKDKGHAVVPSAPMVIKNDPTLMFTNAGMNQFKDLFLGNSPIKNKRIADTQKCLRVSGKHNDLEEVGVDTYHHTMFEMLGNWSFGDYFKKEAIAWAWELLVDVYKIPKDRLYVTVFEGDAKENLSFDQEAYDLWKDLIDEGRILKGSKKDNFWEMGDTGPCGPCTEIHVDIREDVERLKIDAKTLVNNDHPQVIEIWNNVFMEFNRKADGSLEKLPAQHVDTGMGFERLCMVVQGKKSNYDSDVFQDYIQHLSVKSGIKYTGSDEKSNIAMRVISDHLRAVSFAISDGQLPSNTSAGYVIRRILRRAVRYGFSFLNFKEPFIFEMVDLLANKLGEVFPELSAQKELIKKVIQEEEVSFLRTLDKGINRFYEYASKSARIEGDFAFELYDTFGFPIDLTQLLAREEGKIVDMDSFNTALQEQKSRSRAAATVDTEDWVVLLPHLETTFVGYDQLESEVKIIKYRKVKAKGKEQYQIVLNKTPFYAESGGQVGDSGFLQEGDNKTFILDTKKELGDFIHFSDALPTDLTGTFRAIVNSEKRQLIANNHSATHLLHAALRELLGTHVEQKGSLVNSEYLRFDFSHFSKINDEDIRSLELRVNQKIRENIKLEVLNLTLEEAKKIGAMALFGEKYGDTVRVIIFDKKYSLELCGGTHVKATGEIGLLKIVSEGAVAAGVRRIEAITANTAEKFVNAQLDVIRELKEELNAKDLKKSIESILSQNDALKEQVNALLGEKVKGLKTHLKGRIKSVNGLNFIAEKINLDSAEAMKDLSFQLRNEVADLFLVLGNAINGKPNISVMISENLVNERGLSANTIVRDLAKEIQGGGGGQAFYATAGGNKLDGLDAALSKALAILEGAPVSK